MYPYEPTSLKSACTFARPLSVKSEYETINVRVLLASRP